MRTFMTAVLGLSFVLGPAVSAQTGGTPDKAKSDDTKKVAKGGDDKGGKALDKAKTKAKGGDKDKDKSKTKANKTKSPS